VEARTKVVEEAAARAAPVEETAASGGGAAAAEEAVVDPQAAEGRGGGAVPVGARGPRRGPGPGVAPRACVRVYGACAVAAESSHTYKHAPPPLVTRRTRVAP